MSPVTLFWILLAQASGGSAPALTKLALDGLGPWSLVVVRQILGTGFLALLLFSRGRGSAPAPPFSGRDRALLLVLAWGGFALPQILNAIGLQLSTASHGALLIPLEPIGILIGGALLLGEPVTRARALAVGLGIAGATLIVAPGSAADGPGDFRGDLLMAAGHLSWAIYTLAAKPLVSRHDPLRVSLVGSALSPLPLLPLAAAEPVAPDRLLGALGWIVLLAFVTTAVGTFAWNRALRSVSAGTMATSIFVQPVWGLALGAVLLGESVGPQALAGAALILVGVGLGTWRR